MILLKQVVSYFGHFPFVSVWCKDHFKLGILEEISLKAIFYAVFYPVFIADDGNKCRYVSSVHLVALPFVPYRPPHSSSW
jgi:hypothetical protein